MRDEPHIAILLATYNGERFLREQLDSFAAQTHKNWSLWVSDDGSTDETLAIIEIFRRECPNQKVTVFDGPCRGYVKNFFSLMMRDDIEADYYALSDQDDVWLPNKLARATSELVQTGAALYCSRTLYINDVGTEIGISPLFARKPSFENALVQSIAGGNTMVLTHNGLHIARKTDLPDVVSHDWWLYLWLTFNGYGVVYDYKPLVRYRQHGSNLVGSNQGMLAKFERLRRLARSEFRDWNGRHVEALSKYKYMGTDARASKLEKFAEMRQLSGLRALKSLYQLGLYRQTFAGQLALYLASFIRKL